MKIIASILFAGLFASGAHAAPNATPLGLELGVSSCSDARAKFQHPEESPLGGGDVWMDASNPDDLYPGASKIGARCSHDRVVALQIEASKGGMRNEAAQQAYNTLSRKYQRVAGGPMPALGNGFARFVAGNTVIEQDAPHLSFEMTITYYDKVFYDLIKASNSQKKKQTQNKKESAL